MIVEVEIVLPSSLSPDSCGSPRELAVPTIRFKMLRTGLPDGRQLNGWHAIKQPRVRWTEVDGDPCAAALSNSLLLSPLPLVFILVSAGSLFVDRTAAKRGVVQWFEQYFPLSGEQERGAVETIRGVLEKRGKIGVAAFPLLLWGSLRFLRTFILTAKRIWHSPFYNWWRLPRDLHPILWCPRLLVRRTTCRRAPVLCATLSGFLWWNALTTPVMAQGEAAGTLNLPASNNEEISLAPAKIAVQPIAHDEEIRKRLSGVMEATGWFKAPEVKVVDGVVFLSGRADSDEIRAWAGSLARNTQDVVAVANRIKVDQPSAWNFREARNGLLGLWHDVIRSLPFLAIALLILALSAGAGWFTARSARTFLGSRIRAKLLQSVLAGGMGVIVFLGGTYIVLRVSGLTQLALTIVGGTGLVGLAVGIAFRNITENFLASIFLSVQRPFETGDLVEIVGVTGYVQQLNIRTTVLITLDGNLVQIPNAAVYKSTIQNFTATPARRENFVVGIGYDDTIDEAQEVALKVLVDHPAVLKEPEPWVLADNLGQATVNLKIYFWINGNEHSWLKVRSSVIRLVKRAFQQHGISMPDEAREVVFPRGVPVTLLDGKQEAAEESKSVNSPDGFPRREGLNAVSTKAEAGLSSEASILEEQARQAKPVGEGDNLLGATTSARRTKADLAASNRQ